MSALPGSAASDRAAPAPRVALVTGGNKGLGRETVRRLIGEGLLVYLAARDAERGRRAADELGARPLVLDVTSDQSVASAAATIEAEVGRLDILVNNAGTVGALNADSAEVDAREMQAVLGTNVIGIVRVTHAFLPLLNASTAPVIVNVSSGMGSLSRTTDPTAMEYAFPSVAYASSKAAVNMLTVQYAKAFPRLRVNAVDPGYTATDATGGNGKSVEEGARAAVRMALIAPDGPTGSFTSSEGPVPW